MDYDAYHLWLGIPPEEQPPSHYRLLGLRPFEKNDEAIRNAAERQRAHVKKVGGNVKKYEAIGQQILNEIEAARICLLNPTKRAAYDVLLRNQLSEDADDDVASAKTRVQPDKLLVGSDKNCDIVMNQPTISGVHCSIIRHGDKVHVRDLKSINGTTVNLQRIVKQEITPCDLILLARYHRLKLPASAFPPTQTFRPYAFVGRSEHCEIPIESKTISSFHARFVQQPDGVTVEDFNSTNGTFLIDEMGVRNRLQPFQPTTVAHSEFICFGKHQMQLSEFLGGLEKVFAKDKIAACSATVHE